jgi:RimJ/RimL family protein N-acetyltransferase
MNFSLRKAEEKDCELFFRWVNESSVRTNAINKQAIDWKTHTKWFTEKIHSADSFLFVLTDGMSSFGQIRFDLTNWVYTIDYSIDPAERGKGLGSTILTLGLEQLRAGAEVQAYVQSDNIPSIRCFRRCGFTSEGEHFISNQRFLRFKYFK